MGHLSYPIFVQDILWLPNLACMDTFLLYSAILAQKLWAKTMICGQSNFLAITIKQEVRLILLSLEKSAGLMLVWWGRLTLLLSMAEDFIQKLLPSLGGS